VAGEGGARELTKEVRVPIWGIGGGGAHRCGLAAAKEVGSGATVSSGGGRCGDGGARWYPKVALDRKVALATEEGGRLGTSTVSCGGQLLSGRLGVARRHPRVVRDGQCFGAWSRGAR
jgi:hypothetical protein